MHTVSRRPARAVCAAAMALCAALAISAAAGCGGSPPPAEGPRGGGGKDIPLRTLAQGSDSEYGRINEMPIPEDAPPECLAISGEEEFQRFLSLAYLQEPIAEVDFDRHIVIAAMQGPKITGGYSITVTRVLQEGGEVRVEITLKEPHPEDMTIQVLTSPYHLVLAERSAFDPRGELAFTFFDQEGNLISQSSAEI